MICGKDLIIKYLDESRDSKERIQITTVDKSAPPFNRNVQVGRDSIDLRIGTSGYKILCNYEYINTLDFDIDKYFDDIDIKKDGYLIKPGETIVVSTVERIKLTGNITGELIGRTRFARMGLSVCIANKFQSYSDAIVVLQLTNHNRVPLKIFPYQKLVQLIIHQVDGIPNEVRGNYHNEGELLKPIITEDEYQGFDPTAIKVIKRQKPKILDFISKDGEIEDKKRLEQNNRTMKIISKIANSLTVIFGLIIGILCSISPLNITAILTLSILSVCFTIMAVILDTIKDNNHIN